MFLSACSTNPATGDNQFTALLPASQEASVGAQEHQKVQQTFGDFVDGPVADYVSRIGNKIAAHTERKDVQYKFFVIDSPVVNAFALPGGYIYVSRGLLALANSEAEVAGVLGHEIGHITARHAAERVSQGALVGLGAAILSAAVGDPGVSRAAGLGSELYIKSYSRGQESQADELGVRYISRSGYDTMAMAGFLNSLDQDSKLEQKISGQKESRFNYFSTHPVTHDRVVQAAAEAQKYAPGKGVQGHETHLNAINGLIYGDSADQGFVRGQSFYHPKLGFTFSVPDGFDIHNSPQQVVATHSASKTIILFDAAGDKQKRDPLTYLTQGWLGGKEVSSPENVTINGFRAGTAAFSGTVQGRPVTIRAVAIEWKPGQYFRFQMAIPTGTSASIVEGLKKTTYSFRRLRDSEKNISPARIRVVTADPGQGVSSLAGRMAFRDYREERFRVLNGLKAGESLVAGRQYKIVVE